MEWWIQMLAGIGAFWSIFGAICSLAFVLGGFIALKKGSFEFQEKIKEEERETLPPATDSEKSNDKEVEL